MGESHPAAVEGKQEFFYFGRGSFFSHIRRSLSFIDGEGEDFLINFKKSGFFLDDLIPVAVDKNAVAPATRKQLAVRFPVPIPGPGSTSPLHEWSRAAGHTRIITGASVSR
ncbi:hypothetical protein [Tropicimonas sp. IMCC6043]|uniref:hypothetical protein n=1 Tax=Tropicimonas sp. IMCC6043 TaxID=2510645 RepID=UPI00101D35E1|nr:hypothetical protein [Tropicimonas sp. IMCC6043]